jgi:hypothetical protein
VGRGAAAGRPVDRLRVTLAALAAAIVIGCSALPLPATMQIALPPGVTPHTAPARIEALTIKIIHDMEVQAECVAAQPRVLRMTLADVADIPQIEPNSPLQVGFRHGLFAWIVRAEGTFTTRRGRRVGVPRPCVGSGYIVYLDRDATVLGMGFP